MQKIGWLPGYALRSLRTLNDYYYMNFVLLLTIDKFIAPNPEFGVLKR
jgi:hypothetical protein